LRLLASHFDSTLLLNGALKDIDQRIVSKMSETPHSGRSLSRFSTPVPELDDHRFQVDNHSLLIEAMSGVPGGTGPEMVDRAALLQVQDHVRESRPISRDFEQAIVDDDRDIDTFGRRMSVDPCHRHHRRRSRNQQDMTTRSRGSSVSDSSSSPPNSVDAFADPRRRERANTVGSHTDPDLDIILQRTVSGGSHTRRRTFSNASAIRPEQGDAKVEVAESVCDRSYQEPGRIPVIDYEELEEFVALHKKTHPPLSHRKHSMSSQSRTHRIFHDLRPKSQTASEIPHIVVPDPSPERSSSSDGLGENVEKVEMSGKTVNEKEFLDNLQNTNQATRFSFFSSECQTTIHASELGDLVLPGDSFRDLFQLGPEGGVWWLDIVNPTEAEVGAISRAFSVHPLTAEDIMTQEAREKVELFKQYYFVCFRTFYQVDKTSEDFLDPVNVYMVVYRDGVLSFSFSENNHAANVRKRIGKLRDYVSLSSDWICYAMM
jgi:magnesium transporter